MVIWILGLSGSGKSTLAREVNKLSKNRFIHVDGDAMRKIYDQKLGHTLNQRRINASRISKFVKYISDQNTNVIVSVLSNFPKWLIWNRKHLKNYFQVYLKTDINILKKRKPKMYSKKIKNVVGIDIKFNEPKNSDLIISNSKDKKEIKKNAKNILKKVKNIL